MPNIGPLEIIIVLLILIVIFGPKRIPELGRSVGQGMRNFKQSVTGRDREDEPDRIEDEPRRLESDRGSSAPLPRSAPSDSPVGAAATRPDREVEPSVPSSASAPPAGRAGEPGA